MRSLGANSIPAACLHIGRVRPRSLSTQLPKQTPPVNKHPPDVVQWLLTSPECVCRRLDQDDFKRVVKQGLVVLTEVSSRCCCHSRGCCRLGHRFLAHDSCNGYVDGRWRSCSYVSSEAQQQPTKLYMYCLLCSSRPSLTCHLLLSCLLPFCVSAYLFLC